MMAGVVRRDGLREAVTAIETHNGTSVTPENLRWAATHEAMARSWIGDVLNGIADALDAVPDVPPDPPAADLADDLALDYIRAYYALVTAARALLDAMTRFGPGDSGQLWDAAQALRALVGDETPGTGEGA